MEIEQLNLIKLIHNQNKRGEDKLLEFMNLYHLSSLRDATVEQLREYAATHCYINMDEPTIEPEPEMSR